MSCGGTIDFESAQKIGYIAPDLSKEEWKKRQSEYGLRLAEDRPPVPIDHRGLIWVDNKIMVNLFKCTHHVMRVNEWMQKKENRASINVTCGIKS